MMLLTLAIISQVTPTPIEPQRKFTVVYDDGRDSKCLVSELTRDWTAKSDEMILTRLSLIQRDVMRSVILVPRRKAGPEFRDVLDGYPWIRYGDYGEFESVDRRAFGCSGSSLLTMRSIVANATADVSEWESECRRLTESSELRHVTSVLAWMEIAMPDAHAKLVAENYGYAPLYYMVTAEGLSERYGKTPGYPKYVAPSLPANPVLKMPWERGFVFP